MRKWSRRFPRISPQSSQSFQPGRPPLPTQQGSGPANFPTNYRELKELLFRVFQLESVALSAPYVVSMTWNGVTTASVVLVRHPTPIPVAFPVSLTTSVCKADSAATAQTDFDVQKNGVSFGTIRFAAAATTATFISASGASFIAGDVLKIIGPATPDATLAGLGFSLYGTR